LKKYINFITLHHYTSQLLIKEKYGKYQTQILFF